MRAQDRADFEAFVAARAAALRRTAYLLCGDWHEAEDVVQTALTPNGGIVTSATPVETMQHAALVLGADGSTLLVLEWAETPDGDDVALPAHGGLTAAGVEAVARKAATAWTGYPLPAG